MARAETPRLIVAIMVDQLRQDYLERFEGQFTDGGFRLLTRKGAMMTFARYDYCPTVTAPGHATFLSGCTPAMHGIIANDWLDKKTRQGMYCCGDSSVWGVGTATNNSQVSPRNFIGSSFADQLRLHYRSKVVGISMKDRGAILPAGRKPAGAYWFESKSGNFVTSSYYRPELPAWVREFNDRHRAAWYAGRTWDRLVDARHYRHPDAGPGEGRLAGETNSVFPHRVDAQIKDGFDAVISTPFGNDLLAEFARATIEGEDLGRGPVPDLLCISFSSVDAVGHRFGPYSHEVQDAVLRLDRQLADLFRYLDRRVGLRRVAMVLSSDHGVSPDPEFAVSEGLDGQRLNESQLMVDLLSQLDGRFGSGKYFLKPSLYGGNLYFNHDTLREKGLAAETVAVFIRDWVLATGKFQAAYTREQLLDGRAPGLVGRLAQNGYNAERGGDMMLIPKPFVIPSSGTTGTTHGAPYTQDTLVPVLFYGSAFRPGRYAGEFYMSDIAPTLCAALRIAPPSGCMGKPFVTVLRNP
ncbi:MAG: alkaline phosphatase family protein [Verrucomicrobia bacterium]|nr:alkaline phosphatase family protein [Verrucomicrobiota bacterium]